MNSHSAIGPHGFGWKAWFHAGLAALFLAAAGVLPAATAPLPLPAAARELRLSDYLDLVLERNEALQAQMLGTEAGRRKSRGEWGVFEPTLMGSVTGEANKRTNNVEQAAAAGGRFYFTERNNIYDSGLEALVPTGAKIRLGYTLSDLANNVNPFGGFISVSNNFYTRQYMTFVGATITQPLLKNGGTGVSLANIRLAALESDIAFQQYRRQLMLTLSQAEAAYWNLYFTQEQLRFFHESVAVAESLLSDSREKLRAGQSSELDVMEAQSGLAVRRTKLNEARLGHDEAMEKLRWLYAASPADSDQSVRVVDVPNGAAVSLSYSNSFQLAYELNPDYLAQLKKVEEERIRCNVARNQLLPELNARGAYGYNGLGLNPGESWDLAASQEFPSWSLGIELRIPLGGGVRSRNYYQAAKLTLQEAVFNLNSLQTQIANALGTAIQKAASWRDSIGSYQTVVGFNEDLLKTQLARFDVGRVEAQKVLEVEASLFDARQNLAQALVQYQRALIEVQLLGGTILKNRNQDLTREELRRKTEVWLRDKPPATRVFQPVYRPRPLSSQP